MEVKNVNVKVSIERKKMSLESCRVVMRLLLGVYISSIQLQNTITTEGLSEYPTAPPRFIPPGPDPVQTYPLWQCHSRHCCQKSPEAPGTIDAWWTRGAAA